MGFVSILGSSVGSSVVSSDGVSRSRVVRVYCQLEDGSIWEGDTARLSCHNYGKPNMEITAEDRFFSLFHTDVLIENFDSVKQIKELLKSNPNDFLEKIINPETYKPTELGAKIIRNINPNEEDAQKLYKSLKTIEKRAEWFDPSRLLGYSDVDGDPATIAASVLKESIKGSVETRNSLLGRFTGFKFDKKVPKEIETLMETIFKGYTSCSDYPGNDEKIKKRILTIISFFVEFADLLLNQQ